MSTTTLGSQWLYKLIKHSSSLLFGLVLANAAPLLPAQAVTETQSPITQNLSQLDSSLQDSGAGTDSLRFTPEVGPVAEPSSLVAQAITAAEDGTGTVVTQTDNTFDITGGTQAGSNLFHSFEQLGLDANQVANILSNPNITNILGRVGGGDASVINGLLQVTGGNSNLYLMNPAGIVFGPNAQVITPGSFAASTADAIQIGDEWFNAMGSNEYGELVGEPSGYAFAGGDPGAVINAGNLSAGESVTLLGGVVVNTGTVETPGGTINISAVPGENLVSITQGGNLLSIALPTEARSGLNGASQGLAAESISALLSGAGMGGSLGVVVEDGVTKLVSTGMPIPTSAGTAIVAGTLDVADDSANGMGGAIDVLGERVALLDAMLQASGTNGGGTVRVGGDYRGQGPVANARETFVSRDSTIDANAIVNGDGGRVIVWADDNTSFSGGVSASGGSISGNGGFVEISGKEDLLFSGNVDLSANRGSLGTLLLDPTDVSISSRDEILRNSGNVIVEATNNITVAGSIEFQSSGGSITFIADSDNNRMGDFRMLQSDRISTEGRNLKIVAENITAGALSTFDTIPGTPGNQDQLIGSGRVELIASNTVTTGAISTGDEDFTDATGTYVDNGSVTITARDGSISITTIDTAGSSIELRAEESILTGALETNSDVRTSLNPSVTLVARRGNIQIGYIDTGTGGIVIDAAGSFRAIDSTTIDDASLSFDGDGFDYPPEFFDYLASQGFDRDEVIEKQPSLSINRLASLVIRPSRDNIQNVPITIRYGNATRVILDTEIKGTGSSADTTIKINILGDFFQPFVLSPYRTVFLPDSGNVGNDLSKLKFYTTIGTEAIFPSNDFPADASGLAGSIVFGTLGNSTFYGSVENIVFEGEDRPRPVSVEEQRTVRNVANSTFCEESATNTLVASGNLLTVDERLLPEDIDQTVSTQAPDFCNQEEEETTIVSDASELGEKSESVSVVEP